MMIKALVIKTAGDPAICRAVAGAFESAELRHLRLENAVLRANRDALRAAQLRAIREQVDAYFYGRQVLWIVKRAFWRAVEAAVTKLEARVASARRESGDA